MKPVIYLDNNATTPLDPRVLEEIMPYLTNEFGNASSMTHRYGRKAHGAIDFARERVAELVQAKPEEIIFTSGATEAINTALKGVFEAYALVGKHFVTAVSEHKAVLDTFAYLERKGAHVTYLSVDENGAIDMVELAASIREDTVMLVLMAANNETGVCHPIDKIASLAQERGVLFFCDATQWIGKKTLNLHEIPIDMLALSAHKMYGPKGVGALYVRRKSKRTVLTSLFHGGSQENYLRAGTYNTPGIVGLGKAAEIARLEMLPESLRLGKMRDALENSLLRLPEVQVNGADTDRLSHVSNITFRHLRASDLMTNLPNLALSAGSACVSGDRQPSHVLKSMGHSDEDARSSIRVSFGRFNTELECQTVMTTLEEGVLKLRSISPIWQLYERGLL